MSKHLDPVEVLLAAIVTTILASGAGYMVGQEQEHRRSVAKLEQVYDAGYLAGVQDVRSGLVSKQ